VHRTFYFHLNIVFLFQFDSPLAFSFLTCEYGHMFDAYGKDIANCLFGGQQIATHDTIWDVMYAFAWKSGHAVWKNIGMRLH